MRLEGKVALITGGARGIGAAMAKVFAREGAKVVIGDILEAEGHQVEGEIAEAGGEALFVPLDVTQEEEWRHAIDTTIARYGKLNILVNNAAILRMVEEDGVRRRMGVEETSPEVWEETIAVNAKGTFLGTKVAIPEMRKAGGGAIVNISSSSGMVGLSLSSPSSNSAAYSASKGAARSFTRAIAIEHAKDGIRANSIYPGIVETDMNRDTLAKPGVREAWLRYVPLARLGHPEDIAYGALYLASQESSFVTGAELVIDGGFTAQ